MSGAPGVWASFLGAEPPDIHNLSRLALCEECDASLTESQIRRGARVCSSACRARRHEKRDPRISNASIEQLEAELLRRLNGHRAGGASSPQEPTARAATRNVRVLKVTWMKLRSIAPASSTFMATLERIVHETWVKEGLP